MCYQPVQRLQQLLSQAFAEDVSVILFGSYARGDATPESDIDVLAVLPDPSPSSISIALDIAWEIGYEAGMVISLIPTMKDELGVDYREMFEVSQQQADEILRDAEQFVQSITAYFSDLPTSSPDQT